METSHDYDAHAKIDSHEKVCAERYGNINQQLMAMNARFDSISSRMWAAAVGSLAMVVVGLASVVFTLLFRGHTP